MWQKIKHAWTRTVRHANDPTIWVYVRWYSKHSCQWSKWRKVRKDFMDSDHDVYVRLANGQKIELSLQPYDTAVKKGEIDETT